MENKFILVFDEVILKQLKKLGEHEQTRILLSKMLNKIELLGPLAGKLIDSHLFLYEIKAKHPSIRLYYKHVKQTNEIYVFEYEQKTSEQKQQKTITKLQLKERQNFRNPNLHE